MSERAFFSDKDLEGWLLNAQQVLQELYGIKALAETLPIAYPHAGDLDAAIEIMERIVARLLLEQKRRQAEK